MKEIKIKKEKAKLTLVRNRLLSDSLKKLFGHGLLDQQPGLSYSTKSTVALRNALNSRFLNEEIA